MVGGIQNNSKGTTCLMEQKLKDTDMRIKIKKELKPSIYNDNKIIYDIPDKAKAYYKLLTSSIRQRSFIEKYWDKIFPNKYMWKDVWIQVRRIYTNGSCLSLKVVDLAANRNIPSYVYYMSTYQ